MNQTENREPDTDTDEGPPVLHVLKTRVTIQGFVRVYARTEDEARKIADSEDWMNSVGLEGLPPTDWDVEDWEVVQVWNAVDK